MGEGLQFRCHGSRAAAAARGRISAGWARHDHDRQLKVTGPLT